MLWNEQRILLKYSFHQTKYAKQNPDLLGNDLLESVLKDYNGQTYWLNFNLHSFFKDSNIPKWLDLSVGYGGEAMLNGVQNTGNQSLNTRKRYRQYYLSFDVNLRIIKTNSPFLNTVFEVLNILKIPFPTLEISEKQVITHLFYN